MSQDETNTKNCSGSRRRQFACVCINLNIRIESGNGSLWSDHLWRHEKITRGTIADSVSSFLIQRQRLAIKTQKYSDQFQLDPPRISRAATVSLLLMPRTRQWIPLTIIRPVLLTPKRPNYLFQMFGRYPYRWHQVRKMAAIVLKPLNW